MLEEGRTRGTENRKERAEGGKEDGGGRMSRAGGGWKIEMFMRGRNEEKEGKEDNRESQEEIFIITILDRVWNNC